MIVRLERSGGFTGIPLRGVVDSAQLEASEADQLRQLVEAAGFFDLPAAVGSPGQGADRFRYTLTVEQGGRSHTVEVGEGAAPEALQALIRQVTLLARRTRRA